MGAGDRAVGLIETAKEVRHFVLWDADARIGDFDAHETIGLISRVGELDADLALLGELDGVAGQVEEHLA